LGKEDREKILRSNGIIVKILMLCTGVLVKEIDLTKDERSISIYRKYLGEKYQPEDFYTTVISNHSSWIDILYIVKKHSPSLFGKSSVRKVPILSFIGIAMNAVFIDRTSKESRAETVLFVNLDSKYY
jgi:hypothetical protein